MDSVTQATLGAILGETILGRRLGNKAPLWGAVIGTLPDLDVLVFPWLDSVQRMAWHRGLSHSLLFVCVLTPLLALLMHRVHRDRLRGARMAVAAFVFLDLSTHVLIDCFTIYGTQVLEPFSSWRCAIGNLFIIDPLFTLPMLVAVLVCLFLPPAAASRRRVGRLGLAATTAYALLSLSLQAVADARFARAIATSGIPAERWQTSAGPLQTLYWRCLVDAGPVLYSGYLSVLDPADRRVVWQRIERDEHLLGDLADSRAVRQVRWFSDGYYAVRRDPRGLVMSDLRFGDLDLGRDPDAAPRWIFDFVIGADGDSAVHRRPPLGDLGPRLAWLIDRALGRRPL